MNRTMNSGRQAANMPESAKEANAPATIAEKGYDSTSIAGLAAAEYEFRELDELQIEQRVAELLEHGYCIVPASIPTELLAQLRSLSLLHHLRRRPLHGPQLRLGAGRVAGLLPQRRLQRLHLPVIRRALSCLRRRICERAVGALQRRDLALAHLQLRLQLLLARRRGRHHGDTRTQRRAHSVPRRLGPSIQREALPPQPKLCPQTRRGPPGWSSG